MAISTNSLLDTASAPASNQFRANTDLGIPDRPYGASEVKPFTPIEVPEYDNTQGYDPSKINVEAPTMDETDTVSSRITSLLDQNSELMKRAGALGQMRSEQTGAGSSSMASRAAQSALYDVATPIAMKDSETAARYKELGFNYDTVIGKMNEDQRLKFEEMDKSHSLSQDILKSTQDFQRWSMERGWSQDLTKSMMNMYTTLSSTALNGLVGLAGSQQATAQEGADFTASWKDAIASLTAISGLDLSFE